VLLAERTRSTASTVAATSAIMTLYRILICGNVGEAGAATGEVDTCQTSAERQYRSAGRRST
jgi:hypothetical protein